MFSKILIANRGEIAVRIIKTCRRMGIGAVAVYSEADSRSLHVEEADETVFIGEATASRSYLDMEKIINAAILTHCEAVHPGYGFLSENPEFCRKVVEAGLTFIGPSAEAIAVMGDKIAAKKLAAEAGMPVIRGCDESLCDLETALSEAEAIGYPVIIKPAAGGGGKGMRVVLAPDEMASSLSSSQAEARKAFGDDRVFLEHFVSRPRHIEVQVLADCMGNTVYMPERECSVQRRHQKIIEESPSFAVDSTLRSQMGECAVALAKQARYENAGTVEYILDSSGKFYFLEMNTRLQVEHPVTEMVTGLDLVEQQIRMAAGERLALKQKDIPCRGWSIEARICSEDPERRFMPSSGMITRYAEPWGRDVRVDSGIRAGSRVGVFYDSMLSKVICRGNTRKDAIRNITNALNGYHIEGFATNVAYVNAIVNHPVFVKGDLSTSFISECMEDPACRPVADQEILNFMALASVITFHNRQAMVRMSLKPMQTHVGAVHKTEKRVLYMVRDSEGASYTVKLSPESVALRTWTVEVNDRQYKVVTPEFEFFRRRLRLTIDTELRRFLIRAVDNFYWISYSGVSRDFEIYSQREWELLHYMPEPSAEKDANVLTSPMPGLIVGVLVKSGDRVFRGQDLVVMESMKMESGVPSPRDAEVEAVLVKPGQAVETGDVLVRFA